MAHQEKKRGLLPVLLVILFMLVLTWVMFGGSVGDGGAPPRPTSDGKQIDPPESAVQLGSKN